MHPLGNRSIMLHLERTGTTLSIYQRVLGMTLASLPFWLLIVAITYGRVGPPCGSEVLQSALIALSSGVIATLLFFRATDMVRTHTTSLAAVEATQAAEVLFVLLGDVWLLGTAWPGPVAVLGIGLVLLGIAAYSALVRPPPEQQGSESLEAAPTVTTCSAIPGNDAGVLPSMWSVVRTSVPRWYGGVRLQPKRYGLRQHDPPHYLGLDFV